MKPIIFAFLAITLYASISVVLEQKFGKYNTIALTFLFTLPFIPLALIFLANQKISGEEIAFPRGWYFWLTMLLGALYFIADYFYLGAFTSGGDAMTIATIVLLGPAVVAIGKYLWVGGYPNFYQIAGYILIAIAVLLITKGTYYNNVQ